MAQRQFIQDDAQGLNRQFYEVFDPAFLLSKAYLLRGITQHFVEFSRFFSRYGVTLEVRDIERLNAEIYFSEFHQFETLFALLLAPFQSEPHLLYVNKYRPRDLKKKVEQFLQKKIAAITNGHLHSETDFISTAVYSGLAADEAFGSWATNLENIFRLFQQFGTKYVAGLEHNAYKHGLRMLLGPSSFRFTSENGAQASLGLSEVLRFFEIVGEEQETHLHITVERFESEESMSHLVFMERMLSTIRATRLGRLKGNTEIPITTLYNLDRDTFIDFNELNVQLIEYEDD